MTSRYDYGACNVENAYNFYFNYLLSKLDEIFIWKGEVFAEKENGDDPDVDSVFLNHLLFLTGKAVITPKLDGVMRVVNANLGGEQTGYYMPSIATVANPIFGDKVLGITDSNRDALVCYNSKADRPYTLYPIHPSGLFNLIKQTATMLADNVVSINCAQINMRVQAIVTAETPALANSAELQLKSMYAGKPYVVVKENMVNKLSINPIATSSKTDITELTELQQYIIAQFFNSVGIKSNAINKKERLITDEINYIDDYLAVTLDSMLESRVAFCKKFNAVYGEEYGNIDIEINPILRPVIEDAVKQDSCESEDKPINPMEVVGNPEDTDNTPEDTDNTPEVDTTESEDNTVKPLVTEVESEEETAVETIAEVEYSEDGNECRESESKSDPESTETEDKEDKDNG